MSNNIISLKKISKNFGSNCVLNNISVSFERGKVHCILGKNGVGKTTLMKLLMGVHNQDSGEIYFDGELVSISDISAAHRLGIRMLYQESHLIQELTVADNIYFLSEPTSFLGCKINHKKLIQKSEEILQAYGLDIDPKSFIRDLSPSQKQLVSILKAISANPKVLIFDEPTTSLAQTEIDTLLSILRKFKEEGKTILLVTHHIEEVLSIADSIVIMRDARIEKVPKAEYGNRTKLIEKMVGKDLLNRYPRVSTQIGIPILEFRHVSHSNNLLKNLSFSISKGEIVGVAGVLGSGKSSICELLNGTAKIKSGTILYQSMPTYFKNPRDAYKKGISYVAKEEQLSLMPTADITQNIMLGNWDKVSRTCFLSSKKCSLLANYYANRFAITEPISKFPVKYLSSGTKKKIVLSRSLLSEGNLVILDDPSRFLEVSMKVELYNILNIMAQKGIGILLISSDLEELVGMCDKILVLHRGELIKVLQANKTSSSELLNYSIGGSF